ncbi:hypothetical protein WMY93_018304 [Mugilogobius chulae]|uniref:Reverse transcriptase RNase H-like domain-containing protein n=1 Tax=Mugilogobius chulae TaxID=88201 RepID=A0AAW0NIH1_9GOBI
MEDGSERPIGFVSRTLQPAETRYSQLDKEGLAVIFGVEKFHKYLYGRNFTIYTDHKPLIFLFNEKKPIPQMGSPRVQRWAVKLSAYKYNIVYKPGKHHANADALSRLPVPVKLKERGEDRASLMMDLLDETLDGLPETDPSLKPFHQRRLELSTRDGCVLWGARVVIPTKGREKMLKLLHQTHTESDEQWPGDETQCEGSVSEICPADLETRMLEGMLWKQRRVVSHLDSDITPSLALVGFPSTAVKASVSQTPERCLSRTLCSP